MALESKPLSIANVQDGQNPFLHTAYAWSSDGKDRFTLQYPNENLMSNTATPSIGNSPDIAITNPVNSTTLPSPTDYSATFSGGRIDITDATVRYTTVASSGNAQEKYYRFCTPGATNIVNKLVPFEAGKTYELGVDIRAFLGERTNLAWRGKWYNGTQWVYMDEWNATALNVTGDFTHVTKKMTIPEGAKSVYFSIQLYYNDNGINVPDGVWFEFKNLKVSEKYSNPYTPAPSEDFVNAYPLYMGQYTDYVQEPSTEPSKYTWMRTTGQNGSSVKSTKTEWAINTSSVDEPTTGWSTTIPTLEKGKYLWTRTTWEYTDSTTSVAYTVNYIPVDGATGNGVKSIAVTYAVGTSGTTQPSTGWQATPPNVTGGQYLWTRIMWTFTDNTNQTTYSVARFGQDGISVTGTQSEYVQTTSSVEPTSGWNATRPTPQIGMWLWVRSRNTLSNGTYTNWVVTSSYTGRDSIFISATAPSNPTTGTLWQKPNDPTVLKWNGTAWENWGMSINNIVADNVIAENGMFKKVSGVEIVGSTIRNPYNVKYSDNSTGSGEITLENSQIKNNIKQYSSTGVFKNAHSQTMAANFILMATTNEAGNTKYNQLYLDPDALSLQTFSSNPNSGGNGYGAEYSSTGLRLTDSRVSLGNSKLEIHDLIKVETTILDPASGWQRYSDVMGYTNTPTATRVGRTVQIAGAFKPINQLSAGQYIINQPLPVWARPLNNVTLIHQGSGMNRLLLEVRKDGAILVSRYGTTVDSAIPSGAWINISCVYAGQDLF